MSPSEGETGAVAETVVADAATLERAVFTHAVPL